MSKKDKKVKAGSTIVLIILGLAMLGGGLWLVSQAMKGFFG